MFIAPCSFEAARFAVLRWHYSRKMPAGKLVKFGVWDHDGGVFQGAILFGRGATPALYVSFSAKQTELVELVRVALAPQRERNYPTSKAIAVSLRILKKTNPGIGIVISFADLGTQDHEGTIYKASNWLYLGESVSTLFRSKVDGGIVHPRTVVTWDKSDPRRRVLSSVKIVKLRYAYPLTREWRKRIAKRVRKYRASSSTVEQLASSQQMAVQVRPSRSNQWQHNGGKAQ